MKKGLSTGNQTKAESARIDKIKRAGCICCIARGFEPDDGTEVEAHHLLSGGIRRGHRYTLGLCLWHHKGRLIVEGWNHARHRLELGPSLLEGSVPFHAEFGTDDELLAANDALIGFTEPA